MHRHALLLSFLLLLCVPEANAQSSSREVGIQGGPSLAWLRGNDAIDNSGVSVGPAAFLTVERRFTPLLSLRAGLGYQRKGMSADIIFTDVNGTSLSEGEYQSNLDYLVIPVMLRASFGEKARLIVSAGPYIGYLLSARDAFKGEGYIPSGTTKDNFNEWDMGISASLGWSIPLNEKLALQAEVRYDKGLTNISAIPVVGGGSIRTNATVPMLGCSYLFGKSASQ